MAVTHAGQIATPAGTPGFTAGVGAWLRAAGGRLARRSRTSAAKAAGAPIGPAERVLTIGHDLEGSLVVATGAAVYIQGRGGGPGRTWMRLEWQDVDAVLWDDRNHVLALTGVRPGGLWRKELALESHTALVDVARERVASTLLASTAVRLGDQVCARVTARRQPGSGRVVWMVVLNGAAGISNPAIRARVEAAIADLQADTGIPGADTAHPAWLLRAARCLSPSAGRRQVVTALRSVNSMIRNRSWR